MIRFLMLFAVIIATGLSCHTEHSRPAFFTIHTAGFIVDTVKDEIRAIEQETERLTIETQRNGIILIEPWKPLKILKNCLNCRVNLHNFQRLHTKTVWVVILKNQREIIGIGKNSLSLDTVLPGWKILKGPVLQISEDDTGDFFYSAAILTDGQMKLSVAPDEAVSLTSAGRQYQWALLGARQPKNAGPLRVITTELGETVTVSVEEPDFTADWIWKLTGTE